METEEQANDPQRRKLVRGGACERGVSGLWPLQGGLLIQHQIIAQAWLLSPGSQPSQRFWVLRGPVWRALSLQNYNPRVVTFLKYNCNHTF